MDKNELKISWQEYLTLIKELAAKIRQSSFSPDYVVGIARGGLIPGEALARNFKIPLAILSARSYGTERKKRNKIFFSRDLAMTTSGLSPKILLVDDLTETGETLNKSRRWLGHRYGDFIEEIKTAVLWHKEISAFVPDFFVKFIEKDNEGKCPWIIQPMEAEFETSDLSP
ncbi:MAG: phosphoribosyltransferase [Candidatus Magasanikbacteria bacterium]|nr:phosphoribosyltransferase [Candidatus Magasanikbacteria bacterium]